MSKTSCDNATEFKCTSGSIKCIPRSSVNNQVPDCSDESDENVVDFRCFEYEFRCIQNTLETKQLGYTVINRCISYEMVNNDRQDCIDNEDEFVGLFSNRTLIRNCDNSQLFLCLDQSRCLPKRLQ